MKHSTRRGNDRTNKHEQTAHNTQHAQTLYQRTTIYHNNTTQFITSTTNHNRVTISRGRTGDMRYDARLSNTYYVPYSQLEPQLTVSTNNLAVSTNNLNNSHFLYTNIYFL